MNKPLLRTLPTYPVQGNMSSFIRISRHLYMGIKEHPYKGIDEYPYKSINNGDTINLNRRRGNALGWEL